MKETSEKTLMTCNQYLTREYPKPHLRYPGTAQETQEYPCIQSNTSNFHVFSHPGPAWDG